ncbi:class I SAM-dependent methyltransferase [Legionella micdadei]|uniref:Methyltransferase domain-containing protein n=1 Tax=Legionella micdadei TaxID=451 RepID=A0A098GIX8_LEGMI|nr:class I SAM-dependent methyltransferase [Legionella micdadei]ARG96664.1 hypothetical protein B6N58_02680 [Legionella micdadei]KTD26327.1 hypothetical protein Lmic_2421 [Legionella micdadei]CEG61962.1 protein of unknown function [Legionella micdadei]SCY67671.1 Methyltransferase domain-containing protein [Legionella micdadei]
MFELFNKEEELAFSDHDFYGLAAEYNLFENTVSTVMHNDLLGWYDNHDDPVFHEFKKDAMWSMCQNYKGYNTPQKYRTYMLNTVKHLNKDLPHFSYWNDNDNHLVLKKYIENGNIEFHSYKRQLNYTKRMRFLSMKLALDLLKSTNELCPTLVEVGTLRDKNVGGGHSTIKFAEYCSMYGGHLYSIDVDSQAIKHAIENTKNYHSWISFHEMDSVEFLQQFENPINFLYLDGLDSLPGDEEKASLKQLEEIKTALPKLTERAIVLLDDADLFNQGKTKYSSQYLEDNGFSLYVNNYQKLYARGFEKSSAVRLMLNRYAYKIQSVWKKY